MAIPLPPAEGRQTEGGMRAMAARWTVCLPRYCIYAYACPVRPPRRATLPARQCLRFAPEGQRPAPGLSPYALALLERLRGATAPSAPGG
jgi:hypothetical protein